MTMRRFPERDEVEFRKNRYKKGTRVEALKMADPLTTIKAGSRGTVDHVDDIGTVHINWDCGAALGAAFGADAIVTVPTIPENVQREIQAVRFTSATNMFQTANVVDIAKQCGFDELAAWLPANKKLYSNYILTGEVELPAEVEASDE